MVQARSMDTCPSIVQDRAQFMALLKNIPPSFWLWFPEMMFEDMLRSTTWHLLMLRNWRCWSWTRGKRTWLAKAFVAHPWLLTTPLSTITLSRCSSPLCLSNILETVPLYWYALPALGSLVGTTPIEGWASISMPSCPLAALGAPNFSTLLYYTPRSLFLWLCTDTCNEALFSTASTPLYCSARSLFLWLYADIWGLFISR